MSATVSRFGTLNPISARSALPALMGLVLALSGCVNYGGIRNENQIATPDRYDTTESLPSQGGQWPSSDWTTQFGDPQLTALVAEAVRGNPTVAQAKARLDKANSYVDASRSTLYPQVNGGASASRLHLSENLAPPPFGGNWYSNFSTLVSASWDLDLWGKNRARTASAVSQQKAAMADLQQARLTLTTSVARTYNHLAQLYALRENARQEVEDRTTIGKIADDRVAAGLDTNVEQQTARGDIATSQASLSQYEGEIEVVRYQLAALLGEGPDRGLHITPPILGTAAPVALPDALPADLIARRPDIVAARWQVEAALQDVKEAKAEFFPDVNLSASIGLDALGWGRLLKASSRQFDVGPAIHLPIFDAGALRAQLKDRYADFDADVASYDRTLIDALSDVATQVSKIRSTDRQLIDAQTAQTASTRAYQLAVGNYKAGLSPQLQVLQADESRLAAEQSVTNLTIARRDQQMALIQALGGGFDASDEGLTTQPTSPAASAKP